MTAGLFLKKYMRVPLMKHLCLSILFLPSYFDNNLCIMSVLSVFYWLLSTLFQPSTLPLFQSFKRQFLESFSNLTCELPVLKQKCFMILTKKCNKKLDFRQKAQTTTNYDWGLNKTSKNKEGKQRGLKKTDWLTNHQTNWNQSFVKKQTSKRQSQQG